MYIVAKLFEESQGQRRNRMPGIDIVTMNLFLPLSYSQIT
jgi:hypothetical protein